MVRHEGIQAQSKEQAFKRYTFYELLSADQEGDIYLFFDRCQFDEFEEYWRDFRPSRRGQTLPFYQDTIYAPIDNGPLLVKVVGCTPTEELYYWVMEQESRESFGLVIRSTLSIVELKQHFHPWMICQYPDNRKALLRFYDPRVLKRMWPFLNDRLQRIFYPETLQIYLPVPEQKNQLVLFEPPRLTEYVDVNEPFQCWQLDQYQFDHFCDHERINPQIVSLWRQLSPSYQWYLSYESVRDRFHEGLAIGKKLFPHEPAKSIELFALSRFYLGSEFYLYPDFQSNLETSSLQESIQQLRKRQRQQPDLLAGYHQSDFLSLYPDDEGGINE